MDPKNGVIATVQSDNIYYNQIELNHLPGQPLCHVADQIVGKWSTEIRCREGKSILNDEYCTLRCPEDRVPSFAQLYCSKGVLSPPGFLVHHFWSVYDQANGFQVGLPRDQSFIA